MALLVLLALANLVIGLTAIAGILGPAPPQDWLNFEMAAARAASGLTPYVAAENMFRWSPVAAYVLIPIVEIGFHAWRALHLAVVLALVAIDRRLGILVLLSFPFWIDVGVGNIHVFIFVAAVAALMGYRVGIAAYLILFLLVPRPLSAPIAIWILYTKPEWRLPFLAMFVVHLGAVLMTGWGYDWLWATVNGPSEVDNPLNLSPSRFLGWAWVPIGIVLGIWAARRGRIGIASVLVSPYFLPPYGLMALVDLRRADGGRTSWRRDAAPAGSDPD